MTDLAAARIRRRNILGEAEGFGHSRRGSRRKRQQALADLLDHLAAERGGLDTPEDEAEIARYVRLLAGMADEPGELRAG